MAVALVYRGNSGLNTSRRLSVVFNDYEILVGIRPTDEHAFLRTEEFVDDGKVDHLQDTLPAVVIDDIEHPKAAAVGQLIGYEIN